MRRIKNNKFYYQKYKLVVWGILGYELGLGVE